MSDTPASSGPKKPIVERIQSDDARERADGEMSIVKRLKPRAERYVRAHGLARRIEVDSVINGLVLKGGRRLAGDAPDDDALLRRLVKAMQREIVDRVRTRRKSQREGDNESLEALHERGEGPATRLVRRSDMEHARGGWDAFQAVIDRARLSAQEREIVELRIVRRLDWSAIVGIVGGSNEGLRQTMTRMRKRLLRALIEPIISTLPEADRGLADMLIAERDVDSAREAAGCDAAELEEWFATWLGPALARHYGAEVIGLLVDLLPAPRRRRR